MTDDRLRPLQARAILLVLVVAALTALAWSSTVHDAVLQSLERANVIIARHPIAGPVIFVGLAGLSAMLAFFSSAVLVPPAVLARGPVISALLLWAGWMLGGLVSYAVASTLGRPALRWVVPERSFARYQQRLTRDTRFGHVLLLQLALPSEIPGYLAGLARYPLGRYLGALAIAEFPYAVGTMLLGQSFVERRIGMLLSLGAVAALAGIFLARSLRQRAA